MSINLANPMAKNLGRHWNPKSWGSRSDWTSSGNKKKPQSKLISNGECREIKPENAFLPQKNWTGIFGA
jgi:hypothetical protein